MKVRDGIQNRLTDSLETALALTDGLAMVDVNGEETINFSQSFACPDCGVSIEEVEPRSFSFNNPFGACPDCYGLGYKMEFDMDLIIPDPSLSIHEGAIVAMGWGSAGKEGSYTNALLNALCEKYHFDLDTPYQDYPEETKEILVQGHDGVRVPVLMSVSAARPSTMLLSTDC